MSKMAKMLSSGGERPPEEAFLLDFDYVARQMNPSGKPSTMYNPSSLGCIRQMYYKVRGADSFSDRNSDLIGISESGTDRHKRIQEVISSMSKHGVACTYVNISNYIKYRNLKLSATSSGMYETRVFDSDRNMMFACDGIVNYKDKFYILEIKTESSFKWNKRGGIAPEHLKQAYTYSLEFEIDDVLFIYENRDTCQKKAYILHVTDEDRQSIVDLLNACNSAIASNTLPDKPLDCNSCKYCAYKNLCDGDVNA
jgi:CRISPR/Cas system-associated exonuclease Cas4 (RecB family)